jgi:RNA-directed DNA polymerase
MTLNGLQLEKHPEKTFIGKIERGFEFLGYHFRPGRLTIAPKTVERFVERAIQLYEQEPGETRASSRLGTYVQRWRRWVWAGLHRRGWVGVYLLDALYPSSPAAN